MLVGTATERVQSVRQTDAQASRRGVHTAGVKVSVSVQLNEVLSRVEALAVEVAQLNPEGDNAAFASGLLRCDELLTRELLVLDALDISQVEGGDSERSQLKTARKSVMARIHKLHGEVDAKRTKQVPK